MFNSFNWFGSVAVIGICPSLDPQDPVLHWGLGPLPESSAMWMRPQAMTVIESA
ncbi:MAG: hypothetical protein O9331_08050 [Acidovorax sp.]|nr:hypothetical protein [Acidovorax sp.]